MSVNKSSKQHIWCVIPVFNHTDTVKQIALECKKYLDKVIVVDDGSTDADIKELFKDTDIKVLQHKENRGKGEAINTALDYLKEKDAKFMITIDADGQHDPKDLEKFIHLLQEKEETLIIGIRDFNTDFVPDKSKFGRKFANFWLNIEAGIYIDDCQSGFRAYPVKYLNQLNIKAKKYGFETEVLAKAAWAGLELVTVPVKTTYKPAKERISYYRPFIDTLRISWVHTKLVLRNLLPWPHKQLVPKEKTYFDPQIFTHPVTAFKKLLYENTSPLGLATAAGVGVLLGTLPLISLHTVAIIYVTTRLHLNKVTAVTIQNLCIPPFVPIACIQLGHYLLYGKFITEISFEVIIGQLGDRLWEWLIGSLILAPLLAGITGIIVFITAKQIQRKDLCLKTD